jgi:hypothetical protein
MHFTVTCYTSILARTHSADHSNNILQSTNSESSHCIIFSSLCCMLTLTSKYLYQHSVLEHSVCSLPLIYQIHTRKQKHWNMSYIRCEVRTSLAAILSCTTKTSPQNHPASCKMSPGSLVPGVTQPMSDLYQNPHPWPAFSTGVAYSYSYTAVS